MELNKELYNSLLLYLQNNYTPLPENTIEAASDISLPEAASVAAESVPKKSAKPRIPVFARQKQKITVSKVFEKLEEPFSKALFGIIRDKELSEVNIYKAAGVDRKHFSKIRSNNEYRPSKKTALSLAIALHLDLNETLKLLNTAGYTLSHSSKFDLIIEYFITQQLFDIFEINKALYEFDQELLSN